MKVYSLFVLGLLLVSCATGPVNRGAINPQKVPAAELATVTIDSSIVIEDIDDAKLKWNQENHPKQIVQLASGIHVFSATYNNGRSYTFIPIKILANLEAAQEYELKPLIENNTFTMEVREKKTQKLANFDLKKLQGNSADDLSVFIKYVMNPTMDDVGHGVRLENKDLELVLLPDMVFRLTDKQSGAKLHGRRGFIMDGEMKGGKIYLLETDETKMSRDEFLDKSNYEEKAQTVFIPVKCGKESVTLKYVKPDSLKDKTVDLQITEFKP